MLQTIVELQVDHLEIPGKTKVRIPGLKDPVELGVLDYFYYPVVDSGNFFHVLFFFQLHVKFIFICSIKEKKK